MILLIKLSGKRFNIKVGLIGTEAIGHLALYHDIYFSEQSLGLHKKEKNTLEIWGYWYGEPCNQFLLDMILRQKKLRVWRHFGYAFHFADRNFRDSNERMLGFKCWDEFSTAVKTPPPYSFTEEEIKKGDDLLLKLGIKRPFVCIHARDNGYKPWDKYGDYRKVDINTYSSAVEWLHSKGYSVVRVGSKNEKKYEHECVIDYSFSELHSDFMDIYLIANCDFMISGDSGITAVARLFRKKILLLNMTLTPSALNIAGSNNMILHKEYFSLIDDKFLNYYDIFELFNKMIEEYGTVNLYNYYDVIKGRGVNLVDNTKDDILKACIEFVEKDNSNNDLQNIFWSIFENINTDKAKYTRDDNIDIIYEAMWGKDFKKYKRIYYDDLKIEVSNFQLSKNSNLLE